MRGLLLRAFKRFHRAKLILGGQTDLKPPNVGLPITRNRTLIAMLNEDKFRDTMHSELDILSWLYKAAPGFPIDGSKITVIHDPSTFYSTLLEKCKHAKKRITFASLYLGTGKLELELVKTIEQTINKSKGNVEVKILLDFMRGSRGNLNSRKMLEPLLNGQYGHCCKVFLYHTPKLRGFLKAVMPDRFNELVGLQHMKLYMIDNDIIISGANLSNDYFTNRQDRYFLVEDCKDLCNFYNELVGRVGEFSFLLQPDGTTTLNSTVDPLKDCGKQFIESAASSIETLFQREIEKHLEIKELGKTVNIDTWIFPLVQMGQLNIYHDSEITLKLLKTAQEGTVLRLATGYFNLTSEYTNAVLQDCQGTCHFLTAHPTANGFFSAKGVAGSIPAAYRKIEKSFCKRCDRLGQQERVMLWEFVKPGWTYHAKGLWYSLPGQERPSLTLIGSPNFGYRSVKKDLETQIAIVTRNHKLQKALQEEHERLFSCAHPVTKKTLFQHEKFQSTFVAVIVYFFRYYF